MVDRTINVTIAFIHEVYIACVLMVQDLPFLRKLFDDVV